MAKTINNDETNPTVTPDSVGDPGDESPEAGATESPETDPKTVHGPERVHTPPGPDGSPPHPAPITEKHPQ